jgi:preprotein translocase subunit SecD
MEKSWWWKAALFGIVTVLAGAYLVPSYYGLRGVPLEQQPGWAQKVTQKKIQLGLDLQGGLHLVYSVNIDKAVASKVDGLANVIEDQLLKKTQDVTLAREGRDDILVTFKNPADHAKLDEEVLRNLRAELDEVERDAQAGTVRLRFDQDQVSEVQDLALRQAIETIRNRVDKFGVAEPTIIKKGVDIVVELPGLDEKDFERIKNIIGRTAQLEFKIVDDESDYMRKVQAVVPKDGPVTASSDSWREDKSGATHDEIYLRANTRADLEKFIQTTLVGDNAVPGDRELGFEEVAPRDSTDGAGRYWRTHLLKRRAAVTGEYLASADVSWDEMGRSEVSFTMTPQGADKMGRLTGENVGRKMAIVLDEKITSAPIIQSQITDRGRITLGGFGDPAQLMQEAKDLVAVLRSGALPAPLTKSYETQVGRTLGDDAIDRAKLSMYIGGAAVVLFMLIYYKGAGIIAIVAMMLNMLYMVAILAGLEASLTLPGIAGLVLTIGMAVDANIIIYERIREELRHGKSPRSAVDAGFGRAFWTVFDAHVTTFVAGIVLYSYGSGPIRGFAVTLLVGIVANLVTSVWISRWMFDFMVGRRRAAAATISI